MQDHAVACLTDVKLNTWSGKIKMKKKEKNNALVNINNMMKSRKCILLPQNNTEKCNAAICYKIGHN